MDINNGWITYEDLDHFPEPNEIKPLKGMYRDMEVLTLPPPGGGWVVLQILNILELSLVNRPEVRLLKLAQALQKGHFNRRNNPVHDLVNYHDDVSRKTAKQTAKTLLEDTGETTHFSIGQPRQLPYYVCSGPSDC